ncbi:MAG: hypothetical protein RIB60_06575 [Phycisphaerales bacterium]
MSTRPPVNRATATKLTRAAQGAALLLAIGAGAIFALDISVADRGAATATGATPPIEVEIPEQSSEPLIPDIRDVDFTALVERISQVDNAPEPPEPEGPEVVETEPTAQAEAAGDPTISDRVSYLGHIRVGDAMLALLRVDGVQRTARPGAIIPGSSGDGKSALELVRVRDGDVSVRAAGSSDSSTTIERAAGGGAAPSTNTIAARPAARAPIPGQEERAARALERAGVAGAVLERDPLKRRLDSIQRLYDQGRIDEERYETMKRRAEEQLERAQEARQQDE